MTTSDKQEHSPNSTPITDYVTDVARGVSADIKVITEGAAFITGVLIGSTALACDHAYKAINEKYALNKTKKEKDDDPWRNR